jgi:hypothetical protein
MEDNRTTYKIPLFDGRNFSNWKYRVGILLDEKDLKIFIKKSLNEILEETTAEKQCEVKKNEKKCISILVQTLHDSQLENVKDKTTAKDMFDALESLFVRKTISSQLLLRKQLLTMEYDDVEDINDHLLNFETKIRELKATGTKLEDLDVVVHLLLTLPKSYDNLVTALETMDPKNLSLEFVKNRLMDEHNKRKGVSDSYSSASNVGSAMQARTSIICYNCGKQGHVKARCRNIGTTNDRWTNNSGKHGEGAAYADFYDDEQILCAFIEANGKNNSAELNYENEWRINNHNYYKDLFDMEDEDDEQKVEVYSNNDLSGTDIDEKNSVELKLEEGEMVKNHLGLLNAVEEFVIRKQNLERTKQIFGLNFDDRMKFETIACFAALNSRNWGIEQRNLIIGENVKFDEQLISEVVNMFS